MSSNTSNGKRKRAGTKFYAVRKGRTPGVYYSWDDCKAQVDGVSAEYKSFTSLTEAESYFKEASGSGPASAKPTKFYGVAVGHVPGVYTDYGSVQTQVKGFAGAKQKGFLSRTEAEAYVNEFKRDASLPISLRGDLSESSSLAAEKLAKKQKKGQDITAGSHGEVQWEPGTGPLPPGADDGFDPTIKLDPETGNIRVKSAEETARTKSQPTGDFSGPINVYTDGSSLGNGKVGALAGVGVYFGPKDPRNISEALRGERQTNQRAELTAVARALDHVPIDREVVIHTDSRYSISCLTEWFQKWETNGWKGASGKPVDNKDLVEPIIARIREREMCRAKTKFVWIKGHANDPGNMAADFLAVQGSRNSTPDFRNAPQTSTTLNGTELDEASTLEFSTAQSHQEAHDDDAAEMEGIFADLAAEQSANQIDPNSTSPRHIPAPTAVTQLSRAGAKEGQDMLNRIITEDPPLADSTADATEVVKEETSRV